MFRGVEDIKIKLLALVLLSCSYLIRGQIPPDLTILDAHNDLPHVLYKRVENNLNKIDFLKNLTSDPTWGVETCSDCHTDYPKMLEAKFGAQFWVAYTDCDSQYRDSVARTLEQIDVIKRFVDKYRQVLHFATSVDDIYAAKTTQKIASLIGIEGGHSIDSRLSVLRMMYDLGARYLTLTHNCQTPWADSNLVDTSSPVHNLTQFGRIVIKEMNRIGMMVDLSHVSHNVMNQAIHESRAPVIFSHSNAWTVTNHTRNVHDDTLILLKENNGVIMINFYSAFVSVTPKVATINDVITHINYIVDLIGVDHVGIGADYNGVDEVPKGLEDVSKTLKVFELLQQGNPKRWTPENLHKLASGNFLRAFKAVEDKRDDLIGEAPHQDWISKNDLLKVDELKQLQQCTTFFEPIETWTNDTDTSFTSCSNAFEYNLLSVVLAISSTVIIVSYT